MVFKTTVKSPPGLFPGTGPMKLDCPKDSSALSRLTVVPVIVLGGIAGVLLSLNGCTGPSAAHEASRHIQHVVLIVQENRTPDNLFQDPVLIGRHADIAQSGLNSQGQTIPLTQIDLGRPAASPDTYDLDHSHKGFEEMYDGGKMDGADTVAINCGTPPAPNCPPPNPQFRYVNPSDVQPYFTMAEQYTFGDRMFQTNQGPSFPAHQFLISGTSAPTASSTLFAAETPDPYETTGCVSIPTGRVSLIDSSGKEASQQYPCFEHPTLTDLLDAKNLTWRYYSPKLGYMWTAPNAIQHMCGPNATPPSATACVGPDWTGSNPKVSISQTQVLTDIANGNLAQVVWVIPTGQASDHPAANDGSGPSWVTSVVNAIGNSQYWSNTAIFITWDDWGGWYDHVLPPQVRVNCSQWGCGYIYGFRVPLIVISPYAKAQYISHVNHDFGSILKFIEETFDLPSLGYADAAALDDFSDCFDFNQTPLTFQTVPAPLSAEHFLNDRRPPADPDDD
jgi:phospholipase C